MNPTAMDYTGFEHIYLDEEAKTSELAGRILKQLPNVPVTVIWDKERFLKECEAIPLSRGKKMLWLTVFKGPFLKPCPSTGKDYLCCQYWTINAQTNCPMDCSYCILQSFLNLPLIAVFVNIDDVLAEIDALLAAHPGRLFRMGTGELTDSLALDPLTQLNERLIRYALSQQMILEIKTKTDLVGHLPAIPRRNIVVSWSLNLDEIVRNEEHKTSSVKARLKAAHAVLKKGYRLGFHFDPLLMPPDWEKKYKKLTGELLGAVPESEVLWISLGSFRYPSGLKAVIDERFPKAGVAAGEFVKGADGKMRYFRPYRTVLYQKIYGMLRKRWKNVFIYLCMENKTVWKDVMGFAPEDNGHLDCLFHESIARRFRDLAFPAADRKNYPVENS